MSGTPTRPTTEIPCDKSLPGTDEGTCESEAGAPVSVIPEPVWDQTPDGTDDVPQADLVEPLPIEAHSPPRGEPVKVPAMLRRLLPCNSSGRNEAIVAPEDGGRRSRRGAMDP